LTARTPTEAGGSPGDAGSSSDSNLEGEAFLYFPYSLLVVGDDKRVLTSNEKALELVGSMPEAPVELTCCALLGCNSADGVLEGVCLTQLALSRAETLPEVRVDVSTVEGVRALWVTASPLKTGGSHVVLQLRPGIAQDRRRRTDPHWMSGPRLNISVLGRTIVESGEGAIGGNWLEQRTGQLLKYLVAERHRSVQIEEIGESIWPVPDYAIGSSVRYYIHALRRKLEPERAQREPSRFIVSGSGGYRLNLDHVAVDADAFEGHLSAGLAAVESDRELAVAEIERGMAFYRGDFLADLPYAEWATLERHRLHNLACGGLRALAEIRIEGHMIDSAARSLEQLATLQPYDEGVHRQLMELDIMQGRRSDAVRRYDSLRARIRRTFGHEPNFTPADLASPRSVPE
jgi:DNA-binding SARP family transcriptional activator